MAPLVIAVALGASLLGTAALAHDASFAKALHTAGPAPDRADKMQLYGQFIGQWEMESVFHDEAGAKKPGPRGEIHFGWVLEGRAIQDVWILPGVFYGTTLRVYDPGLDAWRIIWSDPLRQYFGRQIGRADGNSIVQLGKTEDGVPIRWSFTDITPDSFHWVGEQSLDGGKTWRMQVEFFARRVSK